MFILFFFEEGEMDKYISADVNKNNKNSRKNEQNRQKQLNKAKKLIDCKNK